MTTSTFTSTSFKKMLALGAVLSYAASLASGIDHAGV